MTADKINDTVAAATFRRLVRHLQHRTDAQNIDLMGLAGFCRNCLANWLEEESSRSGEPVDKDAAREAIYGMPYDEWKARYQTEMTAKQLKRLKRDTVLNRD